MRGDDILWAIAVAMALGLMFGYSIGTNLMHGDMTELAVKHNCAYYDPKTGAFTWKEGE